MKTLCRAYCLACSVWLTVSLPVVADEDIWVLTPSDINDDYVTFSISNVTDIGSNLLVGSVGLTTSLYLHVPHSNFGGTTLKERFAITGALASSGLATNAISQAGQPLIAYLTGAGRKTAAMVAKTGTGVTMVGISMATYDNRMNLARLAPKDTLSICTGNVAISMLNAVVEGVTPIKDPAVANAIAHTSTSSLVLVLHYKSGHKVAFDSFGNLITALSVGQTAGGLQKLSSQVIGKTLKTAGVSESGSRVAGATGSTAGILGAAWAIRSGIGRGDGSPEHSIYNKFVGDFLKGSGVVSATEIPTAVSRSYGKPLADSVDQIWESTKLPYVLPESMEAIHWPVLKLGGRLGTGYFSMIIYNHAPNTGIFSETLDGTSFGLFLGALSSLSGDIKRVVINIYNMTLAEHVQTAVIFTTAKLLPYVPYLLSTAIAKVSQPRQKAE